MTYESLLRLLAPNEHAAYKMTIGGDGRSLYIKAIEMDRVGAPYTLDVKYRNGPDAPIQPVGRYALDLARMLDANVVRIERLGRREIVKLIVHERSGEFYIQLNQTSPSLKLPRG